MAKLTQVDLYIVLVFMLGGTRADVVMHACPIVKRHCDYSAPFRKRLCTLQRLALAYPLPLGTDLCHIRGNE